MRSVSADCQIAGLGLTKNLNRYDGEDNCRTQSKTRPRPRFGFGHFGLDGRREIGSPQRSRITRCPITTPASNWLRSLWRILM